jgi:uncharacterized protein (DUF1800 family)
MVKPPAVLVAGMLRIMGRGVDEPAWIWQMEGAGQRLHQPPDVSGWDESRWLDTSTARARWELVNQAVETLALPIDDTYDKTEDAAAAVAKEAAEELGVLVTLWNTVRDAPDEEQATIQLLMMGCRWDTVMRLKTNIYRWQKRTNKGSRKK